MDSASKLQIDLRQMILALGTTVDLVGMNDVNHGKRVGYIASQIAHQMGFDTHRINFAFELGLLHDCGVSTEQMHSNLVNHFDWEDAHIHCEIGHRLLKDFAPLAKFASPILFHHTPWDNFKRLEVSTQDAMMGNLIFISDRVDVMSAMHYGKDILLANKEIVKSIESYRGRYFNPILVDAFIEVQRSEAFWIALEDRHITRFTWDMGQFESKQTFTISQLKELALIIAYIVDQKSPFTAQHSARVSELARYLASVSGLKSERCDKVEIAALLHDIGKLRMPDSILEKPGTLNELERSQMNQHSYETYEILRHIDGMEDIALWAAYHHEGINGTGYPFHPGQQKLSLEARLLAVADVFQALVQNRPYRNGLLLSQVLTTLDQYVEQGKLDQDVVALSKRYSEKCYAIGRGDDVGHK